MLNTSYAMQQSFNRSMNSVDRGRQMAVESYQSQVRSGRFSRLWARIRGRSESLFCLNLSAVRQKASGSAYAGIKAVPINKVRGSEGRCSDFDMHFRPLNENTRDRWVSIYEARQNGVSMPAIELLQVGEDYYVRDGHHRLSVARALGQETIDAEVTVWAV